MTRRQACGLCLVALLLAGGRLVRHALLVDAGGAWRDPLWLESLLPPDTEPQLAAPTAAEAASGVARSAAPPHPLDLNACPADSLELLPGIGPALAARIVADRVAQGPYRDLDDLQRVKGIGPRLAARLAPHVRFATPAPAARPSQPASLGEPTP